MVPGRERRTQAKTGWLPRVKPPRSPGRQDQYGAMRRASTSWIEPDGSAEATAALVRAVTFLALVVVVGTFGFTALEGWDPWHALYFTLITITTVGYGDEGISEAGRRFALLLLVGGIGIASYSFAAVVQHVVSRPHSWGRRMQARIDRLKGHTIVCGFGRMGRTVCERLAAAGNDLIVVDRESAAAREASGRGYLVVEGAAVEDEILQRAGIARARHLVSAVDSEAENIVISLTARELSPELVVIARAERDDEVRKLRRAGATHIVSPFQSGGREVAQTILDG